jgi:multimeric flavodoxin WrbA
MRAVALLRNSALMSDEPLHALALVCSLSPSPTESSSELLASQLLDALTEFGVTGESLRVVDYEIKPGVALDMGQGDAWPSIRERVMGADILIMATPTWMGQPSSVCQQVLERLDAELSETDDAGRLLTYGKVAACVVVGNEDGAHHISAILYQVLSDVGFTIPAGGVTYWNGAAMHRTDYKDLDSIPDEVASTTKTLAAHSAHLARILRAEPYPAMA